jgi:glycine reductase
MIGVTRVLRGLSVPNVLGNKDLAPEQEKAMRKKVVQRALEILRTEVDETQIFNMEGTE